MKRDYTERDSVVALARAKVKHRQGTAAEEATAIVNALKNLKRQQARERSRQRRTVFHADLPDDSHMAYHDRQPTLEQLEDIGRHLARLTPQQRRVILLYAEDEMSYEDIGSQLGVTTEAVRSILQRARSRL